MELLMYGAGSIGRGFIAPLFAGAGYRIVFVDVNPVIVEHLNRKGAYRLQIVDTPPREELVSGVCAIDGRDADAVAAAIARCDVMATALGAAVLPRVAPVIAQGLALRAANGGPPLDILLCENLKHAAMHMRSLLEESQADGSHTALEFCGLVEAAIGRMVPVSDQNPDDPLLVQAEAYAFLPVDRDAFRGSIPVVPQIAAVSPFLPFEERKLYLHNMGHAMCAYLGLRKGHTYLADAIADGEVRAVVQGAMTESAVMLASRHGLAAKDLHAHVQDLLFRFGNRSLGDTCERVARDPIRKLAAADRLAGAYHACLQAGVFPAYIGIGLAAGLLHQTTSPQEARHIALTHCALPETGTGVVMELYGALQSADGIAVAGRIADTQQRHFYGNVI